VNIIQGKPVLDALTAICSSIPSTKNKKIKIILFSEEKPNNPKTFSDYEAARQSTIQKTRTFESLGFEVDKKELSFNNTQRSEFDNLIQEANNDNGVEAIIVQNPIPEKMKDVLYEIATSKDVDHLSKKNESYTTCATGDAICRVVAPFLDSLSSANLAINGSKGFVGSSVQTGLNDFQDKISFLCCIDPKYTPQEVSTSTGTIQKCTCGDENIKNSHIVVTVVGTIGTLRKDLLNSSQILVVNGSFIPVKPVREELKPIILSDIDQTKLGIALDMPQNIRWVPGDLSTPQNITRVPGGIGPLEMAVLAERVLKKFVPDLLSWSLDQQGNPSFPEWDQILR
jgi:methylenetetrahydrofolate dehydrogenase (NADP+) / methenyltetrahydrofolate cyclohydrolase